jgi:glucokinase
MQSTPVRILSGDIGGTKTRLAVIVADGVKLSIEREHVYVSRDYPSFEEILDDFLQDSELPAHAALGIAGPVRGRIVQTTNLPWRIDADKLRINFNFASCQLLNDIEATSYGLPALGKEDVLILHSGESHTNGNQAVISVGTGLGESGMYWDGQQHHPFATEGGHASFSPNDERDVALLQHLKKSHGHVSWERIISGPGLVNLHEFHCHYRHIPIPDWLQQEMLKGDAAAAITSAALNQRDGLCSETLEWFVRLFGAETGNLALKIMSRGGVYLGGGIAPKILPRLQSGPFLDAFFSKGRMRPLLEAMTVKVILNDRAALYGPASYASLCRL